MSLSTSFHNVIQRYNILQRPRDDLGNYLMNHKRVYKVALIIAHIIRALPMIASELILPFSTPVNIGICFAGSIFYGMVVERRCIDKFTFPALGGAISLIAAYKPLTDLISGVAFASLGAFSLACLSLIPLVGYFTYITLTVSYDVDMR